SFFFFNDTATTEIYTLSLHDALPISRPITVVSRAPFGTARGLNNTAFTSVRSEEHTSELQSHSGLVCRLLLGKKIERGGGLRSVILRCPLSLACFHVQCR